MSLTTFLLSFSHFEVLAFIMMSSYLWIDRTKIYHLIYLIAFSLILNVALKVSFQIPLSPTLGKTGFAFPSGHMQLATVVYVGLIYQLSNKLITAITIILLVGIGWSLIHAGYHNLYDVGAGAFVGCFLVYLYTLFSKDNPRRLKYLVLAVATLLIGYIYWQERSIPPHAYLAYFFIFLDRCFAFFLNFYFSDRKIR